jgi:hypothetical protein
MKYDGRLWTSDKIISFWKYPENIIVLYRILREIEKKENINILYNNYRIEVLNNDQNHLIPINKYIGKFFINLQNKPHEIPDSLWRKMGGEKTVPYNTIYNNTRKEIGVNKLRKDNMGSAVQYNHIVNKNIAEQIIISEINNMLNEK